MDLIEVRGLAPLLQVYDMPTALRFYRDLLGFSLMSTSPKLGDDKYHWVLLQLGDAELMLNTAYEFDYERPASPDPARVTAHQDTIIYLGSPNIDGVFRKLQPSIPSLQPPKIAPYGMKQLFFHDPDGYGICFQWPCDPKG